MAATGASPHPVVEVVGTEGPSVKEAKVAPSDGSGQPGIAPTSGARQLRVLYLFAGARRKSGLARSLRIACKGTGTAVTVDEIDILRGGRRHDLLSKKRQDRYRDRIRRGHYHLTAASPPCGSFSRARNAKNGGPRPLRSKKFVRGFPWLRGSSLHQTKVANALVDFTALALEDQLGTSLGLVILEHPEDLGRVGQDTPGSIWQFDAVKKLLDQPGVITGAPRIPAQTTTPPPPPPRCSQTTRWRAGARRC